MCCLSPRLGDHKDCCQHNGTAHISVEHPAAGLTKFAACFIQQITKEQICNTVKKSADCHQRTDDANVHSYGICEIEHQVCRKKSVDYIVGNITDTISQLVFPVQILFVDHAVSYHLTRDDIIRFVNILYIPILQERSPFGNRQL